LPSQEAVSSIRPQADLRNLSYLSAFGSISYAFFTNGLRKATYNKLGHHIVKYKYVQSKKNGAAGDIPEN
jgi:hypothetical protein